MNEIVVANIGGRAVVCELEKPDSLSKKLSLKITKNRYVASTRKKIIHRTGIRISASIELLKFQRESKSIANGLSLEKAWNILKYTGDSPVELNQIVELCTNDKGTPQNYVAVVLSIESNPVYFQRKDSKFYALPEEQVSAVLAKIQQSNERTDQEDIFLEHFQQKLLPVVLTLNDESIIGHIRNFVVKGNKYKQSLEAIRLLRKIYTGNSSELREQAYDNLVYLEILDEDHPIEIEQSEIPTASLENIPLDIDHPIPELDNSINLEHLNTFTIDEQGTSDRDDAFSLAPGCVWIHIASTSFLVPKGSSIDKEAASRSATLYTPDLTVPMLPNLISKDLGSLNPGMRRSCLSLRIGLDEHGNPTNHRLLQTVIKSDFSFTYQEIDQLISGQKTAAHILLDDLLNLQKLTRRFRADRKFSGAIFINRPEMAIHLNNRNQINIAVQEAASESRNFVSELMVYYNHFLAKYCHEHRIPAIFRYQSQPGRSIPKTLPPGPLGWYSISRYLNRAAITDKAEPHFSLGLECYVQATAPLRRYSDLILQRQVQHFINTSELLYGADEMLLVGQRVANQVRKLARLESARKKYWFLKYLRQEYLDKSLPPRLNAIVLDNANPNNLLAELSRYPFRLRCPAPTQIPVGVQIEVQLTDIDLWQRTAQFEYIDTKGES